MVVVITIVMISATSLFYFGSTLRQSLEKEYASMAEDLALTSALSLDVEDVIYVRDQVAERFDKAVNLVPIDDMGSQQYDNYMAQYDGIEESPQFKRLYTRLRSLQDVNRVESLYLAYLDDKTKAQVFLVDAGDEGICHAGSFEYLTDDDLFALDNPAEGLGPDLFEMEPGVWAVYAGEPIFDSEGNVVALACADISMEIITERFNRILINTTLTILVLTLLFSLGGLYLSERVLRKPMEARSDLIEENKMLEKANLSLVNKAREAQKIAELTQSISVLLDNMPAMTYSKDVEDGRYLTCNPMFVEYAHKSSADEVIGLTDEELFDEETAASAVEYDKTALKMDEPYIFHEEVKDPLGNTKYLQTTKLKFRDPSGRLCILGMSVDVSEMVMVKQENVQTKMAYEQAHKESITYSSIARALSSDYTFLYYVDIKTDEFSEYSSTGGELSIEIERNGEDFFNLSRKNILEIIYSEDQEPFLEVFTKENIMDTIESHGRFTYSYRLMMDGKPVYMNLKAVRMEQDEDHIVIGVNNINDQMKEKEERERLKEEQITFSRISALSGKFLVIYAVDPVTDTYVEYSSTDEYGDLGIATDGDDFFNRSRADMPRVIYKDDVNICLNSFDKENIMREIERTGVYNLDYRLMIEGKPTYVNLKAAIVEEKNGPQLIVGVSDVDARVRREQEYASNLKEAKKKANYDILTGVKNKHAYVELEENLNKAIDGQEPLNFAIIICDVNGLKEINDTQGHKAGDELIQRASSMISTVFGNGNVFRIGGDEFAVVLQDDKTERLDERMAKMQKRNLYNKARGGAVIACGMSIFKEGDLKVEDVFKRADEEMYVNKASLKGGAMYIR